MNLRLYFLNISNFSWWKFSLSWKSQVIVDVKVEAKEDLTFDPDFDFSKLRTPLICILTCVKVLQALRNGEFGHCPAAVQDYQVRCHARFPYAQAFRPSSPVCDNNHITDSN
uniref:Uncharacterized protein n=1 Tax=Timema cristinae TaxID=61476 RepID=A0A7R9CBH1_TIMCR|nr:unnamed protein product [Timema cristinae]